MKLAKTLLPPRRRWHNDRGMYRYADSLSRRKRRALLDRIERWTGPSTASEAEAMGYFAADGRWLKDPNERRARLRQMARERAASAQEA